MFQGFLYYYFGMFYVNLDYFIVIVIKELLSELLREIYKKILNQMFFLKYKLYLKSGLGILLGICIFRVYWGVIQYFGVVFVNFLRGLKK